MLKEDLEQHSLHDLRRIGRKIGVKSPTTLNKDELIKKILEIEDGRTKPFFSKKGRPAYVNCENITPKKRIISKEEIKKIEEILQKAKEEIILLLQK